MQNFFLISRTEVPIKGVIFLNFIYLKLKNRYGPRTSKNIYKLTQIASNCVIFVMYFLVYFIQIWNFMSCFIWFGKYSFESVLNQSTLAKTKSENISEEESSKFVANNNNNPLNNSNSKNIHTLINNSLVDKDGKSVAFDFPD